MQSREKRPRIVLIDDDEVYNAIMLRVAAQHGVDLEVYTSLVDLGGVSMLGRYDLAIVDYHLEQMTGVEIGQYLSALFKGLPMVLISGMEPSEERSPWPDSVVTFMPKRLGYHQVMQKAAGLAKRHRGAVYQERLAL